MVLRRFRPRESRAFIAVWLLVFGVFAPGAQSQDAIAQAVLTQRALAVFGFVALPDRTASALNFQVATGEDFDFRTTQLGGGFRPVEGGKLYLEGFLGWQIYNPTLLLDLPESNAFTDAVNEAIDIRWSSRVATGAVGYNFDLSPTLTFRPSLHLAIGEVASDGSLVPDIPIITDDNDGPVVGGGRLTTGGYGLSAELDYRLRTLAREVDMRARYTWMRIVPLENDPIVTVEADALAASLYGRYRHPIRRWRALDRPVRAVWEAAVSAYPGDQGDSLDTPWLGQIGAGLELETSALSVPYLDRVRLVARYAFGQSYDGYSIGLGVAFRRTR